MQTRRRRTKNARNMRPMYCYNERVSDATALSGAVSHRTARGASVTDDMTGDAMYAKESANISMEFSESPSRGQTYTATSAASEKSKGLKLIGVLVDMRVSVAKVDERN